MMRLQVIDGQSIYSDNAIRVGRRIHGTGQITRTFNHPNDGPITPDKSMCAGCEEDFYNRQGGMNGKGCWSFPAAVVVNKVGYSSIHVAGERAGHADGQDPELLARSLQMKKYFDTFTGIDYAKRRDRDLVGIGMVIGIILVALWLWWTT